MYEAAEKVELSGQGQKKEGSGAKQKPAGPTEPKRREGRENNNDRNAKGAAERRARSQFDASSATRTGIWLGTARSKYASTAASLGTRCGTASKSSAPSATSAAIYNWTAARPSATTTRIKKVNGKKIQRGWQE